jgi:hypothetical protein
LPSRHRILSRHFHHLLTTSYHPGSHLGPELQPTSRDLRRTGQFRTLSGKQPLLFRRQMVALHLDISPVHSVTSRQSQYTIGFHLGDHRVSEVCQQAVMASPSK